MSPPVRQHQQRLPAPSRRRRAFGTTQALRASPCRRAGGSRPSSWWRIRV